MSDSTDGSNSRTSVVSTIGALMLPVCILAYFVVNPTEPPAGRSKDKKAQKSKSKGGDKIARGGVDPAISEKDVDGIEDVVEALWAGKGLGKLRKSGSLAKRLRQPGQPVFVVARSAGVRRATGWGQGKTALDALEKAVLTARRRLSVDAASIDFLSIDMTYNYREVDPITQRKLLGSRIHQAARGLEINHDGKNSRWSPSYMLATNRGPSKIRERFAKDKGFKDVSELDQSGARFRTFETNEIHVSLVDGQQAEAKTVLRGNDIVAPDDVTREQVEQWVQLAKGWLVNNVDANGKMTYLYWPSSGQTPSGRNNMIRQWMATVALGKYAADRNDSNVWDVMERNIDYNLATFYKEDDGLGMVEMHGKVKLGSLGLASIALKDHPNRAKWSSKEAAMLRSIHHLWHDDGSFTTFLKPEGRSDQINFYPGEGLFYLAQVYEENPSEELKEQFMKAFRHYKKWHLNPKNRNPAFTPWHTQANYIMWTQTKNEDLRDFVFEMNDWLLDIQQWDTTHYDDAKGRFFGTKKWFGPPHASATGVYIEGLIDAWRLAKAVGDEDRQEAYRKGLLRGIRSMMQLQFVDDTDMFYVSKNNRDRLRGGMRTAVYDNEVRCDNVQHPLMGVVKVLRLFSDDDFGAIDR